MVSRAKALAIVGGLLAGGFLFLRFNWETTYLFGWEWYQAAALLGGIGLAGVFPGSRLSAAVGLGLGPFLIASVQTCLEIFRDPTCCNLWPIGLVMVLFFGFPAPLIGVAISRLLSRARLAKFVYLVALASSLLIGAALPNIENAQQRRLETEELPGLLRQIYEAEMAYSVGRPDKVFACDGTRLPGVGKLPWSKLNWSKPEPTKKMLIVKNYTVRLDCPNDISPRSFRVTAFPHNFADRDRPTFSIDETGKLTVSGIRDSAKRGTGPAR